MKIFVLLVTALVAVSASEESCYKDAVDACNSNGNVDCNAKYSGAHSVFADLQSFVNAQISHSYDYLLTSTYFGNYEKNRLGFQKLFKELSDKAWENSIDVIKYITKRGGKMDFNQHIMDAELGKSGSPNELSEVEALSRAVDTEKKLANEVHRIHGLVTRRREAWHDPETGAYLEEHFVHKQAATIRELSGHTNDINRFLKEPETAPLALYLFDEFLQKS